MISIEILILHSNSMFTTMISIEILILHSNSMFTTMISIEILILHTVGVKINFPFAFPTTVVAR